MSRRSLGPFLPTTSPRRWLAVIAVGALSIGSGADAAEHRLEAGSDPGALRRILASVEPGDEIEVRGGTWEGPIVIDRALKLVGRDWPVVEGGGTGTVIEVRAAGASVEGFVVRGSGDSLDEENSGIAVEAGGVSVVGNRLEEVLFGIYLRQAAGSVVRDNEIRGMALDMARRGDAIRVWYSDGVILERNRVRDARDVVLWYSKDLSVLGNRVESGRYGLHFMYCDDAEIRGNLLRDNSVGAFLMYSRRLRFSENSVAGNHGPSGYGIGLKDMDDVDLRGNLFVANRVGGFLDNSPRDLRSTTTVAGNLFAANDIGLSLLPNVRNAHFTGNSFAENGEQVEFAGAGSDPADNRWLANHWSDYRGFDVDGDGTGDIPYRSDRVLESLSQRYAKLRLLRSSPLEQALELAARAFPIVRPQPELVDPEPRMVAELPVGAPSVAKASDPGLLWVAGLLGGTSLMLLVGPSRAVARALDPEGNDAGARDEGLHSRRREALGQPRAVEPRPALEVRGLSKCFGEVRALEEVSFEVLPGESVALWGSNGAGKTTTLRALLGVLPCKGSIRVEGLDVAEEGKRVRSRIGFVPQEISFPDDSTDELLRLLAALRGASLESVSSLLDRYGLRGEETKAVQSLSGGRKQRLALVAALLGDPPNLLLDEPTANLDVRSRQEFLEDLRRLRRQGKTIVFSSHRPNEIRALADRVLHLEEGRVVGFGSPEEILSVGLHGEDELHLMLADRDVPRASGVLSTSGFDVFQVAGGVGVRVRRDQKVEPIAALLRRGIPVLDFRVVRPGQEGL